MRYDRVLFVGADAFRLRLNAVHGAEALGDLAPGANSAYLEGLRSELSALPGQDA